MPKREVVAKASASHGEITKMVADRRARTAPQLRDELGLSDATARKSCGELATAGILRPLERSEETRAGTNSRGPAPVPYALNADIGRLVVVELGLQELRWSLTDLTGKTKEEGLLRRPEASSQAQMSKMLRTIQEGVYSLSGFDESRIWGMCAAFAGPIDARTGVVIDPTWHRTWHNYPLREELQQWFPKADIARKVGYLPTQVASDGLAAAYGCYLELSETGSPPRRLVGINLNVGIGSGIVTRGEPLRSALASIGHTVVDQRQVSILGDRSGRPCSCDSTQGHLAAYVAGWALTEHLYGADTDRTIKDFVTAYRGGDARARASLVEAGTLLGTSLATISSFLTPEVYVLSGALADLDGEANPLRKRIEEEIQDRAPLAATRDLRVLLARDHNNVTRRGAALMALRKLCDTPFLPHLFDLAAREQISVTAA